LEKLNRRKRRQQVPSGSRPINSYGTARETPTYQYTHIMIRKILALHAKCHDGINCWDWDIYPLQRLLLISRKLVVKAPGVRIFSGMSMNGVPLAENKEECEASDFAEINRFNTSGAAELSWANVALVESRRRRRVPDLRVDTPRRGKL
jgi:hypothetical protein